MYPKKVFDTPTTDEILELNEGKDLFRSNLFRLQVEELLSEVKVKQNKTKSTQNNLHQLKQVLENLPSISFDKNYIDNLSPPLRNSSSESKLSFTFYPPSNLQVIGSFLLNTICKPFQNVDLAIEIPKNCLTGSDATNCFYEDKRMIYLYHIASELNKLKEYKDRIYFSSFQGDHHKPILCIQPKSLKKGNNNFIIKIHTLIPDQIFKASRLLPSRYNIEFKNKEGEKEIKASPYRNNAILEDLLSAQHLTKLHTLMNECNALIDAILLFKVWLRQRELDQEGCINGFLISMIMIYLFKKRSLNSQMSSYQIFRVTLHFLTTNEILNGITLSDTREYMENFKEYFPIVFLDHTGRLNLTSRVHMGSFKELQYECKLALEYLKESATSGFQYLFLQKINFPIKFDHYFTFKIPSFIINKMPNTSINDLNKNHTFLENLQELLEKALGDRCSLIILRINQSKSWKFNKFPQISMYIQGGILIDPTMAYNPLERGPSAEDKEETKKFCDIWKEKAELWQMNDGSIVHAVQWDIEDEKNHLIVKKQICYLLDTHFGIDNSCIHYLLDQTDTALYGLYDKCKLLPTPFKANLHLINIFEEINNTLTSLSNIPLQISQVHRAHSVLSFIAPTIPTPHPLLPSSSTKLNTKHSILKYVEPITIILEIEENTQWPKDVQAIQALKSAYYVLLSRELKKLHNIDTLVTKEYIDIFLEGYVFRSIIHVPQEILAMEQFISIQEGKEKMKKEIHGPLHLNSMRGLQTLFAVFGPTVRLVKFWIHSQLLSSYFTDQAIELLVAYLFTSPEPYSTPNSHIIGFIRFLDLICNYNWESRPLIVDIHKEITVEQMNEITKHFNHIRTSSSIQYSMYIATPRDLKSDHWTKMNPSPIILQRVISLANQCKSVLNSSLIPSISNWNDWKTLFSTPLSDFDIIIRLYPEFIPYGRKNNIYDNTLKSLNYSIHKHTENTSEFVFQQNKFKNFQNVLEPSELFVGLHPVHCLFNELEKQFGDIAMFFYGDIGINIIGIVWKPSAFLPQRVKPQTLQSSTPLPDEVQSSKQKFVIRNIFDIISDIKSLGEGIISDVLFTKSSEKLV